MGEGEHDHEESPSAFESLRDLESRLQPEETIAVLLYVDTAGNVVNQMKM